MNPGGSRFNGLLVAAISLIVSLVVHESGVLGRFNLALADLYSSWLRHEVNSDIVIISIDENSLAQLNRWPWRRSTHARLLNRLVLAQPKRLFFDIDFSSQSETVEDGQLAEAIARWNPSTLILPAFQQLSAVRGDEQLLYTQPLPEYAAHAALGSVNLVPASDSLVRDFNTYWTLRRNHLPAVSVLLADYHGTHGKIDIDYAISPSSFQTISYVDVLNDRVSISALKGKTIMVGATAVELGDIKPVPVYRALPGVVIQALGAQTIRSGMLYRPAEWITAAALIFWAIVVGWTLSVHKSWRRNAVITLMLLALATAATFGARAGHFIIDSIQYFLIVGSSFLVVTTLSLDLETIRGKRLARLATRHGALLHSVVHTSRECILCVNADGNIVSANAAAERLLGASEPQLLDKSLTEFLAPSASGHGLDFPLKSVEGRSAELALQLLDGTQIPVELLAAPILLRDEQLYTVLLHDLRDRRAHEEILKHQATHDPLTGLPNRYALAVDLKGRIDDSAQFAMFLLDLTRFKEVNDTLGHGVGDFVLCEATNRFKSMLVDGAAFYRMGGDEFVMLCMTRVSRENLARLAQSLTDVLNRPIRSGDLDIEIGVNIGIALYPEDATSAEDLLKNADIGMYVAKRSNLPYSFYSATDNEHSIRRLVLLSDVRAALAARSLELHYQPLVNLRSGRAESVEALLRWTHPRFGPISPLEVIPLIETTDLLRPLTDWAILEALRQAQEWERGGLKIRIAVNLSTRMLHDLSLPSRIAGFFAAQGARPEQLTLEITESAMMLDVGRAMKVVQNIRNLGIHIAVDDYGTGFSSLSYLRNLDVQTLKLDRSFISDVEQNNESRIIVESTAALSHALHLGLVAEGVETSGQEEFLRRCGCDFGQGYYYSKALPANQCAEWLRQHNASKIFVADRNLHTRDQAA